MSINELELDVEEKGIRRVRTPAGVARFKQPIGSIIIRDLPLKNLKLDGESGADGWDKLKGNNGKTYYVGKFEGEDKHVAVDSEDRDVVTGSSAEDVYSKLDAKVGEDSAARKRQTERHDPPEAVKNRPRASRPLNTEDRSRRRQAEKHDPPEVVKNRPRASRRLERDARTSQQVTAARRRRNEGKSLSELAINFDQTRMYEQFDKAVESKDAQTMHAVGKRILNDAKANGSHEGVVPFVEDTLRENS